VVIDFALCRIVEREMRVEREARIISAIASPVPTIDENTRLIISESGYFGNGNGNEGSARQTEGGEARSFGAESARSGLSGRTERAPRHVDYGSVISESPERR
jgi:hypothetical protein